MKTTSPYWFPAKKYGWGWSLPCSWQGWVTLLIYILSVAVCAVVFNPDHSPGLYLFGMFCLTMVLIGVCWVKGEKPSWRWGEKTENHDLET